jgi:hypothetical protein
MGKSDSSFHQVVVSKVRSKSFWIYASGLRRQKDRKGRIQDVFNLGGSWGQVLMDNPGQIRATD